MIVGIGVDLVEISRIAEMRERQGERFFEKVYTPAEVEYCTARKNSDQSLATRFAAKEAVMKALGTGWAEGVAFKLIEVVREGDGAPHIVLHSSARAKADEKGVSRIHLSLSHTDTLAIAQVVMEK